MNKLTIDICPLCGSMHISHYINCIDFYASKEEFELLKCEECNFIFTQNAPVDSEIGKYYETPDYISHSDTKKGIVNYVYHLVRAYMLSKKAQLVIKESHLRSGKILDIGAGTGYFANAMYLRGWEVEAIEKNEGARVFAKEHFMLDVKDEAALMNFPTGCFDVITLWHVMEHLEHLETVWARFSELLTEKGILVVAVPNSASYDAEKYEKYWAAYDVPRHLWHFTPATIQQWGAKHGFILAARHPMPFDAFYISMLSEKYRGKSFPFFRGLFVGVLAWFSSLVKKEKSSSMIYVFRKKR
ncbi:class I SAM-dependent methyltransferase [uncultured Bacteroides sp.]|uniref:class I SAM-dependent methyltransferase n=1 Tax=uncultured Bacteroides sp. TaxID=162156 RepID=UPI002AAB4437|nr:class I SAM-dependent methyltransferase [uncultured Bacteroides sp.]